MSIKYVMLEPQGVSWIMRGVFPATISNKQISEVFKARLKRELTKRGCEESDLPHVNFKMIKEYLDITTMKLNSVKVFEFGMDY